MLVFGFEVEDLGAICGVMILTGLFLFEGFMGRCCSTTAAFAFFLKRLKKGKAPGMLIHLAHRWDIHAHARRSAGAARWGTRRLPVMRTHRLTDRGGRMAKKNAGPVRFGRSPGAAAGDGDGAVVAGGGDSHRACFSGRNFRGCRSVTAPSEVAPGLVVP